MTITEDEFALWRELPISRAFFEKLQRIKSNSEALWAKSKRLPPHELQVRAAECASREEFITMIQNMKAKDLYANRDSNAGQKRPPEEVRR